MMQNPMNRFNYWLKSFDITSFNSSTITKNDNDIFKFKVYIKKIKVEKIFQIENFLGGLWVCPLRRLSQKSYVCPLRRMSHSCVCPTQTFGTPTYGVESNFSVIVLSLQITGVKMFCRSGLFTKFLMSNMKHHADMWK